MRFLLFFLSLFAVLALANRYLVRRAGDAFSLPPGARRAASGSLYGALALIAASRVLDGHLPASLLEPVAATGFAVVLGAAIAAVLLGLFHLVRSLARRAARLVGAKATGAPPAPEPEAAASPAPPAIPVDRRDFLSQAAAGSALAFGGGASFYGTALGRHDYALEEVPIRIPGLARALDGLTIAQLSDVHLGLFVGEREVRTALDFVGRARPDLVVLTGDLLDHDPAQADNLGRMLTRLLPLARRGVIVIPGNHDYYAGIGAFSSAVIRSGARLLRNEGLVLEGGLALLGLDDVWGPRVDRGAPGADLAAALRAVPAAADLPRVVLCHNPSAFKKIAGQAALQLSGHTHGGQVNPGVRFADLVLDHPFIAGRYERAGSQIYVNRGFGTAGPPARLGAPPEVTKIVLVSA